MQDDTQQNTTVRTFGRSSIDRLPPGLRQSVDEAIAGGATLDEIGAHIRAHGHNCSRSAIGCKFWPHLTEILETFDGDSGDT